MRPICADLFCGLGGWAEGFLAEDYDVIGFDIEVRPYPGQLVLQDVMTIHGSQFRNAEVIVASPPCQNYSYLAMPWSRSVDEVRPCGDGWEILNSAAAKEMREQWEREGPDNRLFDACFRIREQAMEATRELCEDCDGSGMTGPERGCFSCTGRGLGPPRFIPLIVENVRGAQPWVGRSAWNFGSFHLWGDVPALMPINLKRDIKQLHSRGDNQTCGKHRMGLGDGQKVPGFRFDGSGRSFQTASVERMNDGHKRDDGGNDAPGSTDCVPIGGRDEDGVRESDGVLSDVGFKGRVGGGWFGDARDNGDRAQDPQDVRKQPDGSWQTPDGTKIGGDWFSDPNSTCRKHGSRSSARKAASAQIAKIPFDLANHIARVYKPRNITPSNPGEMNE